MAINLNQYMSLFDNMLDAFALHEMLFDENGLPNNYRFINVNKEFLRMLGMQEEELINKTVLDIFPETEQDWIKKVGEVVLTGKSKRFVDYSEKTDKYYDKSIYSPEKGYFATIYADVTEIKKAQLKLEKKNQKLELSNTELNHVFATPQNKQRILVNLHDTTEFKTLTNNLEEANKELSARNKELKATTDALVEKEKELLENRQRFKDLADIAFEGLFIHRQGVIIEANKCFCEMIGYKYEELINLNFIEALIPAKNRQFISNKLSKDETGEYELEAIKKDGSLIPVEASARFSTWKGEKVRVVSVRNLSERKKQEVLLKESELRLTIATENAKIATWEYIVAEDKTIASPLYKHLLGFDPNEGSVSGKWLEGLHPEDKEETLKEVNNVFQGISDSYYTEFRYRRTKSENYFWMLGIGKTTEKNSNGSAKIIMGINQDITERKVAEQAEQLSKKRIESLLRISEYDIQDIQDFLDFAQTEAIVLTQSKYGYIYLYNETNEAFTLNTWSKEVMPDCEVVDKQTKYMLEKTELWSEVVRQRKSIIANNYSPKMQKAKGMPDGHFELNRFMSIPVFSNNKIVAVVGVANKTENYTHTDEQQLKLMMDSVWKILENYNTNKKLTEATEEINLEKVKVESVIEATRAGTWHWRVQDDVLLLNDCWAEIIGYTLDELQPITTKTWSSSVHPDDLPLVELEIEKLFSKKLEYLSVEYRQKHKKGHWVWILSRGKVFEWSGDGKTILASGTHIDITDRKNAELLLVKSKEKYQQLFNNMNDGFASHEIILNNEGKAVDYRFLEANPALLRRVGMKRNELIGKTALEIFPNTEHKWLNTFAEVALTRKPIAFVDYSTEFDRYYYTNVFSPAKGVFAATFTDVTEQKKAEQELAENQLKLEMAVKGAKIGLWNDTLSPYREIYVSDEFAKLRGYDSAAEMNKRIEDFENAVHQDDAESYLAAFKKAMEKLGNELNETVRFKTKTGAYKYFKVLGKNQQIKEKQALAGIIIDIDKEKQLELLLKESEEKYRFLTNSLNDTVWKTNLNLEFIYISPAVFKMRGLTVKEAMNRSLKQNFTDESLNIIRKTLQERLSQIEKGVSDGWEPVVLDVQMYKKDGSLIWVQISAQLVGENGVPSGIVGINRDISKQKKAELELKATLEEKEILLKEIHHRVKNNLQTVRTLLFKQQRNTPNNNVKEVLQESMNRVSSMALVHEQMYRSKDIKNVSFDKYIKDVSTHLFYTYKLSNQKVKFNIQSNNIVLPLNKAVPVALVINELISNALKYAFPNQEQGVVSVTLKSLNNNIIELVVSDNGVGLPNGFNVNECDSMGMYIVNSIAIRQLSGKLDIKKQPGTTFTITFER